MTVEQISLSEIHKESMNFLGGFDSMQKRLREEIGQAFWRFENNLPVPLRNKIEDTLGSTVPITQDFFESVASRLRLEINRIFIVPRQSDARENLLQKMREAGMALGAQSGGEPSQIDLDNVVDILIILSALEGIDNYISENHLLGV